jgi:hypothetical protein
MASQKLNIDIVAKDRTKQALGGVQGALGRLRKAVFSLQSAFIGLGAGLVIRNLVNTGKNLENLQVRLKFLLKDTNEGAKAFENMTKFASKVPFSLEEIQSGSGILATVTDNANDLQNMLEITGNVAAVTGLDFRTAAEQIQRSFSAGIGAADLFREKGVRNMLGFKAGATVSIEETVQAFQKVFGRGGQFGQATDDLASTLTGTLSMIGDKIFNFKKTLLDAGFFAELKKQFSGLNKSLEENSETFDKIAVTLGTVLAVAVKKIADTFKLIVKFSDEIVFAFKAIIALKLANTFINIGRAIIPVVAGMRALVSLSGVGLVTVAASVTAATATFLALGKAIDDVEQKINSNFQASRKAYDPSMLMNQLGATQKVTKELEKQEKIHFNIFESNHKLVNAVRKAEERSLDRILGKSRNIFDEQQKLAKLLQPEQSKSPFEGFKAGLESEFDVTVFDRFKEAGTKSLQGLKSSLTDFVMTGKLSFQTLKDVIIRSIVEALVGSVVTTAIKKGTALFKMSAIREGLISVYKGALKTFASLPFPINIVAAGAAIGAGMKLVDKIKGFEKGGAVAKGQPVLVGERGAEMFVPNQTGQITQSARGTGGGAVNVNFNINTVDASGFEDLLFRSRGAISSLINQAVNEQGRGAVV